MIIFPFVLFTSCDEEQVSSFEEEVHVQGLFPQAKQFIDQLKDDALFDKGISEIDENITEDVRRGITSSRQNFIQVF